MRIQSSNFNLSGALRCGYKVGRYIFGNHIHLCTEVVFVLEGEICVTVDSEKKTAKANDIIVIMPFQAHSFYTPEYCKVWICVFSNDFITNMVSEYELMQKRDDFVFTPSDIFIEFAKSKLYDSNEELIELNNEKTRHFKALLHAVIDEYLTVSRKVVQKPFDNTLVKIIMYIMEHSTENITRESVASALGYHPMHISRSLSNLHCMNFRRLVNEIRMEKAKNMLANTNFKIIDIALECGFSNERSFHRAFKEINMITPGEYREKRKGIG